MPQVALICRMEARSATERHLRTLPNMEQAGRSATRCDHHNGRTTPSRCELLPAFLQAPQCQTSQPLVTVRTKLMHHEPGHADQGALCCASGISSQVQSGCSPRQDGQGKSAEAAASRLKARGVGNGLIAHHLCEASPSLRGHAPRNVMLACGGTLLLLRGTVSVGRSTQTGLVITSH